MNIGTMQFFSMALGRHTTYTALLPDTTTPGPYPVLVQLHGRSDSHQSWLIQSRLAHHLEGLPLIVVCPDGAISWWADIGPIDRYETFVMQDLLDHVQATFQVRPGKLAIGGLSMGGFGALSLGLRHHTRFCSVYAHSSAVLTPDEVSAQSANGIRMIGDLDPQYFDLPALAASIAPEALPQLTFDCGTDDFLIAHNRRFHSELTTRSIPHRYHEHPGAHTWEYWDTHVQTAIAQHVAALGIVPAAPRRPW